MPTARAPFTPALIFQPMLDPSDAATLRQLAMQEIGAGITPDRIVRFVHRFLNGNGAIHAQELPDEFFADMQWVILTLAYGNHPEVDYGVEAAAGKPVDAGPYQVQPFRLVKKGADYGI
jgi:hypothetical protein